MYKYIIVLTQNLSKVRLITGMEQDKAMGHRALQREKQTTDEVYYHCRKQIHNEITFLLHPLFTILNHAFTTQGLIISKMYKVSL